MRNLTVTRERGALGSALSIAIYIEDPTTNDPQNDITVDGVKCRLLGFVRPRRSLTVAIPDSEQKIYAFTPRSMQKSNISDACLIPEGTEDISLNGCLHILSSFFKACTFVFDKNISEEDKKKLKKKDIKSFISFYLIIFFISLALSFSAIFFSLYQADKTFSSDGVSITLTTKFSVQAYEGFDFVYASNEVSVFGFKESFEDYPELADYSYEEYGLAVLEANQFDASVTLKPFGESYYFCYQVDGYYYFCVIYKSNDAFWLIQFSTNVERADYYADDFSKWASSVTFA